MKRKKHTRVAWRVDVFAGRGRLRAGVLVKRQEFDTRAKARKFAKWRAMFGFVARVRRVELRSAGGRKGGR